MASTSLGTSIPAAEAVQVLVSSLADESSLVKESAMASLTDIASLSPMLVLDCCYTVSRGGRRKFGNMAGVFQVMALGVQSLDNRDADAAFFTKLAKIATTELITSKEFNAEWQRAASTLLVSIGCHLPDLMLEEIYIHLTVPSSALPTMVQILSEFASVNALQFAPRLKGVLSRVLPILGSVRDAQRPIFAKAIKSWCQAIQQCISESHNHFHLDDDVMSFLYSVYELLLRNWAASRDLKVRAASVEALGELMSLTTRPQLQAALPKLVSAILELYNSGQHVALVATHALTNILNASLLSENGPPIIDFDELTIILSTLLPILRISIDDKDSSDFSVSLKIYNEVQRCFLVVGLVYPDDLLTYLLNKCNAKEESMKYGAVCILKHLLPRSSDAWHSKRILLVDAVKSLLDEQNLGIKKALSELILVMASHCYFSGQSGESFVEYLVAQCSLVDHNENTHGYTGKKGSTSPMELKTVCEKGLLLLTITIPETELILWPFLLKMIIPRSYTAAVATVCRCISELCKIKPDSALMRVDYDTRDDIPSPEELFARLLVLLHNPLAPDQLPIHVLTVFCHLSPLFSKNAKLFWQDEIPKLKAYISDTEDFKSDASSQDAWDDMIVNFLSESLDVIQDKGWMISLGNAFANQYALYRADDEHSALLHRCLGMLLQKVDNKAYVREKIVWMHMQADISIPMNRLGLAKGIGLVAASHLDTVLEKLKSILDNIGQSVFQRILSFFSESYRKEESDDIHAALALMYGYAARYAPTSVIEARIDALVGTNMLSRLLHVRHPTSKQAVITAIDLLGSAVINAANNGSSFPLKKRDLLIDHILTLMGRDDRDNPADTSLDLLLIKASALSACTTLVSVEPKLSNETRNLVMKSTLGFFSLPNEPVDVVSLVIDNLIALLCAILRTSAEDGRSRAELLLLILRQIDPYNLSPVDYQRKRGCRAVYELLLKFKVLCISGFCAKGCVGNCMHMKQIDRSLHGNLAGLPLAFVLPSREALCLGERLIVYIPRCADSNSDVIKFSAQILGLLFNIAVSLPKPVESSSSTDIESCYDALSSLEDVVAILNRDASIDSSEIFSRITISICTLLTKMELVAALESCTVAVCDKVKSSAEGAVQAITELVTRRGNELSVTDIARTTQALLAAVTLVTEKNMRLETLGAICSLAECTSSKIVFDEVLATAGKDIVTKDISRLRGGWPMQDAFYTFSQHLLLSAQFLEHLLFLLNETSAMKNFSEKDDKAISAVELERHVFLASMFALTAFLRGGGKVGKKAVESNYAYVLSSLILQFGSCHGLASSGQPEPLRAVLTTFQAFCECVGDLEMGKILARDGEINIMDKWISVIGDLASSTYIKRPKEVQNICLILTKSFNQNQRVQREATAAALSEFIRHATAFDSLLEQMVQELCRHVSDESPNVRCLCLRGLVQIPGVHLPAYTSQILGVIVALLDDIDESVQLTAVSCLLIILETATNDAVDPLLLNLCLRLRNLQVSLNMKMRADAFAAFGALCGHCSAPPHEAFVEQIHAAFPRLVLHMHEDDPNVRHACKISLKHIAPLMDIDGLVALFNSHHFCSDHRRDYEVFLRDLARQLARCSQRIDSYVSSVIQAFEAPWTAIQANAVYLASSVLSASDDQRLLSLHFGQVFGRVVGKMSTSSDCVVRASCSSSIAVLLMSPNSSFWITTAPPR